MRKACGVELSLASPRDGRALTLGKDMRERKCGEKAGSPTPSSAGDFQSDRSCWGPLSTDKRLGPDAEMGNYNTVAGVQRLSKDMCSPPRKQWKAKDKSPKSERKY